MLAIVGARNASAGGVRFAKRLAAKLGERDLVIVSGLARGIDTVPHARHFPRRNRVISGLVLGVLVVEAAPCSGSLITARLAGEQGREVMAVPCSPLDPRCRGTNNLIRQGAALIETANDVIEALGPAFERPLGERDKPPFRAPTYAPTDEVALADARPQLTSLLGPSPVEIDELLRQSRLTPALLMTILLELELAGRLDRHPGNRASIIESDA